MFLVEGSLKHEAVDDLYHSFCRKCKFSWLEFHPQLHKWMNLIFFNYLLLLAFFFYLPFQKSEQVAMGVPLSMGVVW